MSIRRRATQRFLVRAILVVMATSGGTTLGKSTDQQGHAATQFAAWLAVFNKGDRAALFAYHEQSFPYKVASEDVGDLDRELGLSTGTGGFDLVRPDNVSTTSFTAILKERRSDQHARASMKVDAAPPHRVISFEIHPIPTPDGLGPQYLSQADLIVATKKQLALAAAADELPARRRRRPLPAVLQPDSRSFVPEQWI